MIDSKNKIREWLNMHAITDFTINLDLSVDVNNNVNLRNLGLKDLPVVFNNISGSFDISSNFLNNSYGFPIEVGKDFNCSNNSLSNFCGRTQHVIGNFIASKNKFTSANAMPKIIGKNISLFGNRIRDLKGLPEVVHGDVDLSYNNIRSFKGMSRIIYGNLKVNDNSLFNTNGDLEQLYGDLFIANNPMGLRIKNHAIYLRGNIYCNSINDDQLTDSFKRDYEKVEMYDLIDTVASKFDIDKRYKIRM